MSIENIGQRLNKKWNIKAKHALYRKNGTWYHKLKQFPGALLDENGYILFQTEQDFLNFPDLSIKKQVSVSKPGISKINGYIRVNEDSIRKALSDFEEVETLNDFDPKNVEDARERIARSIAYRRGQPKFRKLLLEKFEGKCAVTGCNVTETLEAAHIVPYKGEQTNVLENGLLLRADIHTLFDLGLIVIDPNEMIIQISSELEGTSYMKFNGKKLSINENLSEKIKDALYVHFQNHS